MYNWRSHLFCVIPPLIMATRMIWADLVCLVCVSMCRVSLECTLCQMEAASPTAVKFELRDSYIWLVLRDSLCGATECSITFSVNLVVH